jgi:rare lipoprotein A (peptidoglycan hydrolase)
MLAKPPTAVETTLRPFDLHVLRDLSKVLLVSMLAAFLIGVTVTPTSASDADGGGKVCRASWYGPRFARRRTASGAPFDPQALTAAHRTLPFGSKVRVTNLHNGRSVVLTITDRGPFRARREIDLSYGAARALGMVERGVATVRVELLGS